jgi:hypothetical protein
MAADRPSPSTTGGGQPGDGDAVPQKAQPGFSDLFWVGTACAISIVGGGAIGYGVDDGLGTLPWFTIAGLVFGVVCAVLLAVNQFRKYV